ncbi:MAG: PAS domain S-box protein, partial [Dehalococcoidia bacterium]
MTGRKHQRVASQPAVDTPCEREATLEAVIAAASDGLIIIDERGIIEVFNPAAEEMFGYVAGEIIGENVSVLMPSPDSQRHDAYISKRLETRETAITGRSREVQARRKDGTMFPMQYTVSEMHVNGRRLFVSTARDITKHKRMEERLRQSEERSRSIIDTAHDAFVSMDSSGLIADWNVRAEEMFGWTREEALGQTLSSLIIPPEDRQAHEEGLRRLVTTGEGPIVDQRIEVTALRRDGTRLPIELAVWKTGPADAIAFNAFLHDITERKQAEESLRRLSRAVEQSPSIVIITDPNGNIEYVNPKFTEVTGYLSEEVVGKNPRFLQSGETSSAEYAHIWQTITSKGEWRGEFRNKRKHGGFYSASTVISAVTDEDGAITNFVCVQEDITERKQAEVALKHLAYHDSLTGLPNRMLFKDRLGLALAQARRRDQKLVLMFLDFDRFKLVNDTVGHAAGDNLLRGAAERLAGFMREGDTVARVGGDEFAILLPEISRIDHAVAVAGRILEGFRRPLVFEGHEFHVTASIGIVLY